MRSMNITTNRSFWGPHPFIYFMFVYFVDVRTVHLLFISKPFFLNLGLWLIDPRSIGFTLSFQRLQGMTSLSFEWGPSTAKRLGKARARVSCMASSEREARASRQGRRLTRYGRHLAGLMCRARPENRDTAARTHRALPFLLISLYSSTWDVKNC